MQVLQVPREIVVWLEILERMDVLAPCVGLLVLLVPKVTRVTLVLLDLSV